MKIITVNLPGSYIDDMEPLTGNQSLYPSRSELIRVAVRDYLLKLMKAAEEKKEEKEAKNPRVKVYEENGFEMISIPVQ